ncbi:hypothetical protein CSUI_002788 [Cystoisospora suis]|uniref:Uncharacterized protein n=1 Tax=Cystoisospora suis TaxID=483139 RepID=A0A2C6KH42_9APIC|nr:hypothetical protein CSUI_002788 [Cystoisospora suis]
MNCDACAERSSPQLHILEAKKTKEEEDLGQKEAIYKGENMSRDREKEEDEEGDFGEREGEEVREVHAKDRHEDQGNETGEEEEEESLPLEDCQRFLCILNKIILLLSPSSSLSSTDSPLTETNKDHGDLDEKDSSKEKKIKEKVSCSALLEEKKEEETSFSLQKDSVQVYVQRREVKEEEEEFSNSCEAELCSLWDAAADLRYARFLVNHRLVDLLLLLLREFILPSLNASHKAAEESGKIEREEEEEEEARRRRGSGEEKPHSVAASSSSSLREALSIDRFAEIFCGCLANLFSHTKVFHEALQLPSLLSSSRCLALSTSSFSSSAQPEGGYFFPREACQYLVDLLLLSSDARTLRESFRALTSLLYNLHHLPPDLESLLLRETSCVHSSSSFSSSISSSSSSCSVLPSESTATSSSLSLKRKEREEEEEECVLTRHLLLLKAVFSIRYSLHSELIASACAYLETLLTIILDHMEDGELKVSYKSCQSYRDSVHTHTQLSGVRTPEKAGVHTPREKEDEVSSLRKDSESKDDPCEKITAQMASENRREEKENGILFNRRLVFPSLSSYCRVLSDLISLSNIDKTLQKGCVLEKDREGSEGERNEDINEGLENLGLISSILFKTSELLGVHTAPLISSPHRFHKILSALLLQSQESHDSSSSSNGWTVGCTYTRMFTRKSLEQISIDLCLSKKGNPGEEEAFNEECEGGDLSMEGEGVLFHSLFSLLDTTLAYVQETQRSRIVEDQDRDITDEGVEIEKNSMIQFLIFLLQLSMRCLSVCTEDSGLYASLLLLLRVVLEARSIDSSHRMRIENAKNRHGEKEEEDMKDFATSSSFVSKMTGSLKERNVSPEKSSFQKRREKEEDKTTPSHLFLRGSKEGSIERSIKPTGREGTERVCSPLSLEKEFEVYIHLFLRNECGREVVEKLVLLRQEEEVRSNPDVLLGILFISQFSTRETLKDLESELLEITQAHIRGTQKQSTKHLSSSGVHTPERSESEKQQQGENIEEMEASQKTGEKETFYRREEGYYTMPELLSDAFLKYLLRLC